MLPLDGMKESTMELRKLTPEYDAALAELIRYNLKLHRLDIPGTVYFDAGLDHLSEYYSAAPDKRAYFVLLDDGGALVGGIGLAEFPLFQDCAELQKLYLSDAVKGRGLGYRLIERVEEAARERGYRQIYLETHTNLQAAMHVYERAGYAQIDKPEAVVHATMNRFFMKKLSLTPYEEAKAAIPPGRYRHFKGREYEVLEVARHSETGEPMVVYRALYGEGGLWVRPAAMWNETVERNGRTYVRFEKL